MPDQAKFAFHGPRPVVSARFVRRADGEEVGSAMARSEGEGIYRRVSTRMHVDARVRQLSKPPPCGKSLWDALLYGEQVDIVPGLFRVGEAAFAEQLDWPIQGFRKAWKEIQDAGLLVKADWNARLVWVVNALKHNMPASPNVVRAWKDCWRDRLPDCNLKDEAREHIEATLKAFSEPYAKAFVEVYSKPAGKASGNDSPKGFAESGAVSSKQLEAVVSSKDGESERKDITACESVDNSTLEGLNPSDKHEVQKLLSAGHYVAAARYIADLRKRGAL